MLYQTSLKIVAELWCHPGTFSAIFICSLFLQYFDPDAQVILSTELTKKIQYQKEYLVAEIETKLNMSTYLRANFQEQG